KSPVRLRHPLDRLRCARQRPWLGGMAARAQPRTPAKYSSPHPPTTLPRSPACCGPAWISTGQLDTAKRVLRRSLAILRPALRNGTPIVVLHPSCSSGVPVRRAELLHGDEDAHRLAAQTHTLAEFPGEHAPGWPTEPVGRRPSCNPTVTNTP